MKLLLVRHAAALPRGTPGVAGDERPPSDDALARRPAASGASLASADWMPRDLDREILDIQLADTVQGAFSPTAGDRDSPG